MSNNSDSDEFYDAEEDVSSHPNRRKSRTLSRDLTQRANSEPNVFKKCQSNKDEASKDEDETSEASSDALGRNRKKFKELRQKLQNDDDDPPIGECVQPDSQTSSVEGVSVGPSKITQPFRVIEHDTVSLQSHSSLGRLGRILGNATDSGTIPENGRKAVSVSALSSSSLDSGSTPSSKGVSQFPSISTLTAIRPAQNVETPAKLQEPDVIASTKTSTATSSSLIKAPVAPPRRKKKNKEVGSLNLTKSASTTTFQTSSHHLASPISTVESLTREFEHSLPKQSSLPSSKEPPEVQESKSSKSSRNSTLKSVHSLDINQALKGQFVVKPQDTESYKARKSSKVEIAEKVGCMSLVKDFSSSVAAGTRGSSGRSSVGHYSLGPHRGTNQSSASNSKARRKSAGDENMMAMKVRTHTDSGKQLSDLEILEQVTVLNLDTGERVPLSVAEDKLPQCINPLSLHIMRLTSEYVSSSSMDKNKESDEESVDLKKSEIPVVDAESSEGGRVRRRTAKLKRFLDSTVKKTMHKAKSIAQEVSHARHKEDTIDIIDNVHPGEQNIKLKTSNSHKGPYEFEKVEHVQELNDEHEGPIWCMKFSCCGKLLATAGQDKVLRIWIVRDAFQFFQEMRTKYNAEKVSPTPSQESLVSHHSNDASASLANMEAMNSNRENSKLVFMPKPFCTYSGHTSDLLDVSWSKNYFILSSSMDKTVRLWHISRKECLCCFQHIDFVTAIVFHPRDDRYFLSGSLDGKLRLWNIPDKKVAVWNEVEGTTKLITAANFCQNGMFAVVGTYDGRCIFYNTDQLKYHTQIHVRSSRGRNAVGRKISGIEPMPGQDKILITSNDSRIRLYDLIDLNVSCKYKGYVNMSSQIKASFSHDGKYVVSGSENRDVYIWKTNHDYAKFSSVRRDRNDFWEAIKAHNNTVTCAIFAPNPESIIKMVEEATRSEAQEDEDNKVEDPIVEQHTKGCGGYVLVSADFNGCIKVFINKMKPKHSSLPVSAMA
ncbi:WD repeat-containing protein 44 isoform X2 [Coccinella septempunctata]|uniref:WD repeat-containing protein 44 isoform X2 n=1 Tax=Coccinella septempunctata TaxID=41139 RepID=UPI001D0633C3|nr:WD repeat-containing protein 44 isoform X2 [Coccinella septempunctata]